MTDEFSGDAMAVLGQLFESGTAVLDGEDADRRSAGDLRYTAGDTDTARQILTSAETVATNKLPEGEFRSRLLDGCRRALSTLDAGELASTAEHAGRWPTRSNRGDSRAVDVRR